MMDKKSGCQAQTHLLGRLEELSLRESRVVA